MTRDSASRPAPKQIKKVPGTLNRALLDVYCGTSASDRYRGLPHGPLLIGTPPGGGSREGSRGYPPAPVTNRHDLTDVCIAIPE
jgi:hypothetical protein